MKKVAGHSTYITIDLTQAYHPLPNHKDDRHLAALCTRENNICSKRPPFGFEANFESFPKMHVSHPWRPTFCLELIDDIVIFCKCREEHAEHVKCVIERLNEAKLIINKNKCDFFSTQISLLGFIVDLFGTT
jgi:hypothetical protein